MKKLEKLFICLLLVLTLFGCESKNEAVIVETENEEPVSVVINIKELKKHGNVALDSDIVTFEENFEAGDIVDVIYNDVVYTMPVGKSYSDVDNGEMICRMDEEDNEILLGINMGNFAETVGIDENSESVVVQMKEKAGYLNEYNIRNLERTYEREDYPELSDAEYANARSINIGDIKEGILYRSSTPIDNDLNRAQYADAYIEENGIKTIINLDDEEDEIAEYEGYDDTYYATCNIYLAKLDYNFETEEFASKVAEAIRYMINNEGSYLVHCKEGKDRAGIFSAILELYMNASLKDAELDYIKSYENYYKINANDEIYEIILETNFRKELKEMFEVSDLAQADLSKEASEYLANAGLSTDELTSLKNILSK